MILLPTLALLALATVPADPPPRFDTYAIDVDPAEGAALPPQLAEAPAVVPAAPPPRPQRTTGQKVGHAVGSTIAALPIYLILALGPIALAAAIVIPEIGLTVLGTILLGLLIMAGSRPTAPKPAERPDAPKVVSVGERREGRELQIASTAAIARGEAVRAALREGALASEALRKAGLLDLRSCPARAPSPAPDAATPAEGTGAAAPPTCGELRLTLERVRLVEAGGGKYAVALDAHGWLVADGVAVHTTTVSATDEEPEGLANLTRDGARALHARVDRLARQAGDTLARGLVAERGEGRAP